MKNYGKTEIQMPSHRLEGQKNDTTVCNDQKRIKIMLLLRGNIKRCHDEFETDG